MYKYDKEHNIVAKGRIILIKRAEEDCIGDLKSIDIVNQNYFMLDFENHRGENYSSRDWFGQDDCFMLEWQIEQIFKDQPYAFYELIGDIHYHGWKDYWGEYDAEAGLVNYKFQQINYSQARAYDDNQFLEDNEVLLLDQAISPFMDVRDIYERFAEDVTDIAIDRPYLSGKTYMNNSSFEEIKDYLTMLSFQAHSANDPERVKNCRDVEDRMKEVLKDHYILMKPSEEFKYEHYF